MSRLGLVILITGSSAMGVASVFGMTGRAEPLLWLVLAIAAAIVIALTRAKPVRQAFIWTLCAGLIAPLLQAAFFPMYVRNNAASAAQLAQLPAGIAPQAFIALAAPVIALLYAGFTALLTFAAVQIRMRTE